MIKEEYYSQKQVTDSYETLRFKSYGGEYVNGRELEDVFREIDGLPQDANILDSPIGTGRLSKKLIKHGLSNLFGIDTSMEMLRYSRNQCGTKITLKQESAFKTTFPDKYFKAIFSLRFFFHFNDIDLLIKEYSRLLEPDGMIIFDTIRWSPRAHFSRLQKKHGGVIYIHSDRKVENLLKKNGLVVRSHRRFFIIPSLLYAYLNKPLITLLDTLEKILPDVICCKSIWIIAKENKEENKEENKDVP